MEIKSSEADRSVWAAVREDAQLPAPRRSDQIEDCLKASYDRQL